MQNGPQFPSIFDLTPSEQGGVTARRGFAYQDHAAVSFILDLLSTPNLSEVWCETHDDIILIWSGNGSHIVEFVQVKSEQLGQLWSVPQLCRQAKTGSKGTSLFEKSLARDRCQEQTRFRIVTRLGVNADVEVLTYPLDSQNRKAEAQRLQLLSQHIAARCLGATSPKGNGVDYWATNAFWDVRESDEAIKAINKHKLHGLAAGAGTILFPDQLEDLYEMLLSKAKTAAEAEYTDDGERKKLRKSQIRIWWQQRLAAIRGSPTHRSSDNLRQKMADAKISTAEIESAVTLRRRYADAMRQPKYLDIADHKSLADVVLAQLQSLKSRLYADELDNNGQKFHRTCMERLENLNTELPNPSASRLPFLLGCMYDITDRCQHRFVKEI